ncbi:MAG: hypothetical protein GYB65_18615, partial [Chloroflexi bacterium]|nr:hypothetical protein [Chloroflexota bacterium]
MGEPAETTPDYLLVGHITHDITPQGPQPGGTVTFAAHTAAAFGLRVGILTSAAPGEPLLDGLPPDALVINVPAAHTTTFENLYQNGARTQYMYHRAAPLGVDALPPAWRRARLTHLAPVAYEVDPQLVAALSPGRICATPQGWMRHRQPDGLVTTRDWPDAVHVLAQSHLTV